MAILDPITEILLPNSNGAITNWSTTSGGGAHPDVSTEDTDYITSTTIGADFMVGFTDIQGSVGSIISVQFQTVFGTESVVRGHNITCRFEYDLSGKSVLPHQDISSEFKHLNSNNFQDGNVHTQVGDPLTNWTTGDVNNMNIKVTYTAQSHAGINAAVDYICLKVKYRPALDTYNTTINNPHITSGNMSISSGNISI